MMQKSCEISQNQKRKRIAAEAKAAVAEIDLQTANDHINDLESQVVELKYKLEEANEQLSSRTHETKEPEAIKFVFSDLILAFKGPNYHISSLSNVRDLSGGHQLHPDVQDLTKELDTFRMKYDHLVVMRDAACDKFYANYIEWHAFKKWWNEFKTYDTVPQKIKAFNRVTKTGTLPVSRRVSHPPPSVLQMTGEFGSPETDTAVVVETQHKAIRTALCNGRGILEGLEQPSPEVPTVLLPPIPPEKAAKTSRSSQAQTDDDQTQDYTPPRPSVPRPGIQRPNLAPVRPPNFNPPDNFEDPTEEEEGPSLRPLPSMSPIPSSQTLFSNERNDFVDRDPAAFESTVESASPTYGLDSNVHTARQPFGPSFPSDSERQSSSSLLRKRKSGLDADITMTGFPETPNDLEMKRKKQKFNDIRTSSTGIEQGPSAPEDPYMKYKGRGRYAQSAKKSVLFTRPKVLQLMDKPT